MPSSVILPSRPIPIINPPPVIIVKPQPQEPPKEQSTPVDSKDPRLFKLGAPKGKIPTTLQIAYGRGGPWSKVNAHDKYFVKYGLLYGVDPQDLKGMEVIESGGDLIPNGNGYPNWGNLQLTHSWNGGPKTLWEQVAEKLRVDFKSAEGQIAITAYVLGGHMGHKGTPREIFLSTFYPIKGGLDVKGPDGHTQRQYLQDLDALRLIIDKAAGIGPAPKPDPTPPVLPKPEPDIIQVITGGRVTDSSYGFKSPTDLPYYEYFEGHGGHANQHTGIDAMVPLSSTLYAPFDGTIVCTGTGQGGGAWQQGCAAFADEMTRGAGRVELLHTDGKRSLILGHCQACLVPLGSKVKAGQPIAKSGGMNAPHVHIEAREWTGSDYILRDPRQLFRSGPAVPVPSLGSYQYLGSPNFMSRQGIVPVALSYHITDDLDLDNVLSWLRNPQSKASSHWVIDRDGTKYQLVGSAMASWTNGEVHRPRRDIPWIDRHADAWLAGTDNANYYTISLEHIGIPGEPFPDAQIASSIEVSSYYLATYPTITRDRGHMTRHADYDAVNRPYCPGDLFPLGQIIVACQGDPKSFGA